jgi:glyoxylase-like metal-dependent hydrolase (beta-lactamase superfamily II)/8-oxo-dGTP pyrophosphatase MutT (NUDIX family)
VNPIAQAASVLLVRGTDQLEIFVVRRADHLRFFGGFLAFPGGKLHPADAEVPVTTRHQRAGLIDFGVSRCVAAVRELFEETGVCLSRQADGALPISSPALDQYRREILAGTISFDHMLRVLQLSIREEDLEPVGRLVTPEFAATRFDTAFYLARLPEGQVPEVWPGELQEGFFTGSQEILSRWQRGELLVSPPTVAILQSLTRRWPAEGQERLKALFRSLEAGTIHPIFFAPEVRLIPLRTQALPPSTHTNAYLVGSGPRYLIDPGAIDPKEQQRLFEVLDENQAKGQSLSAIVLTHHHADHIGAARACAERYQVPIWAHPRTGELSRGKIRIDRPIQQGDHLNLGRLPDDSGPWHMEVLHTPGHASDHLVFYDPHFQWLLAGDMVSTLSSVVIAPPDGDLAEYLASLRRLRDLAIRLLLPGHGSPTSHGRQVIDGAIAHRMQREAMLLAALAHGSKTVSELTVELYRGVPDQLMRFASWQVSAALEKLRRDGIASVAGEGPQATWCLCNGE